MNDVTRTGSAAGSEPAQSKQGQQSGARRPASAEAKTAALLAQFMRYTRYVIEADKAREVAWRIVSQLNSVLPVQRVLLVTADGKQVLATDSGAQPAKDRPFVDAIRLVAKKAGRHGAHVFTAEDDPRPVAQQQAMGGSQLCWVPLQANSEQPADYALWLERWQGKAWTPQELELLARLGPFLHMALQRKHRQPAGKRRWKIIAAMVVAAVMLFPVREHAVATGRIVADQPAVVTAPLSGVIAKVNAAQGAQVVPGVPLLSYDRRLFDQQVLEAEQSVAVARAELGRIQAASYGDLDARAQIEAQKLEVQRLQNQLVFLQSQIKLADVTSPAAGVLQIPDAADLVGRRIDTGERLASVADPSRTKLLIEMPVRDVSLIEVGGEVSIRLDSAPLQSFSAQVTSIGFTVENNEAKQAIVPVYACWQLNDGGGSQSNCSSVPDELQAELTPGQQGNVRVYAGWTVLGYQILRRPLADFFALLGV